jgi:hypothetical protein
MTSHVRQKHDITAIYTVGMDLQFWRQYIYRFIYGEWRILTRYAVWPCKNRRFGGTQRHLHEDDKNR